jgi:hypothetical protein
MGLTRYIQPECFLGASSCIVTTIFWIFWVNFPFYLIFEKKFATKMKEIAKFWESTNFLFQKTVIQLRNDEKSPYLFLRIKEKV